MPAKRLLIAAALSLGFFFIASSAQAAGPNLVANPSVETASSTPSVPVAWIKGGSGTNTRLLTYPVAGFDGAKAVKTEITSYTNGDAKWYFQAVPAVTGEQFAFSDAYTSNVESFLSLQYKLQDGTYKYPDLALHIPAASGWTQISRTFTVPAYASPVVSVTVFHLIKAVGAITTDAYSLQSIDNLPPTVSVAAVAPQPAHGPITLSATATDDIGVAGVQFYMDGAKAGGEITAAPYTLLFDTNTLADGSHSYYAVARDAAFNAATSTAAAFTTHNTPVTTLAVRVTVVNGDGGSKLVSGFPLFLDGVSVTDGVYNVVSAGPHVISETTDAGYAVSIVGDCAADGTITLAAGQNKECTIVNNDLPPGPPPPPANLIANPSVENASSTPSVPVAWIKGGSGTNTRVLTYPVAGFDGAKAIKTEVTSYTNGDAKWYFQPIAASGGQTFTFSDAYTSTVESYLTLQYKLQDGTYRYPDIALHIPASSSWTQISRTFTVPTNFGSPVTSLTVFHLIKTVGAITTDAYALTQNLPPPVDPDNLIPNGSLETPSSGNASMPASWTDALSDGAKATFAYPVAGYDGQAAAQVTVTSYTSGAGAKWYFQNVPVTPGATYDFVDYYKATTPSIVTMQFLMDDGSYDYLDLLSLGATSVWTRAGDRFVAPDHAVSVTAIHLIQSVGTLTTDAYSLKKLPDGSFDHGMVSLDFDDGLASVYANAIPQLYAAGIRSSQYIITGSFGMSGNVDQTQTAAMAANGQEIGAHTRTHPHLTTLSHDAMVAEVAGSKSDLAALGMDPTTFAYPYGEFNSDVEQAVINAGYRGARSVIEGYNTKNTNPYELEDQHVESTVTIETIKGWIDRAIADKTWLILELHDIDHSGVQYSTTPEILQQAIAYVQSSGIQVITNDQGLAAMGH